MALRLETADLSLASLDALEADSLVVFVGPERPLQGLASLVDWRLAGAISRAILSGAFVPASGEALLVPSGGRLRAGRVFLVGFEGGPGEAPSAARRACAIASRAGARVVGASLPGGGTGVPPAVPLVRAWAEAGVESDLAGLTLLGDGRALPQAVEAAARDLEGLLEVARPQSRSVTR